jgi:hypothetical protein
MEAIRARRTYGVSADRIEMDFHLNGYCMGETVPFTPARNISVKVKGRDIIDRVEVIRNNRVIYRDFPSDRLTGNSAWQKPVLCRIEYGWGPWSGLNVARTADWDIDISINNGRILSVTPCFQSGPLEENKRNILTGTDENRFRLISYTSRQEAFGEIPTNSIILEIQGSPDTELLLSLVRPDTVSRKITLRELAGSNDIFFTGGMTSESVMIHRIVFFENYMSEFKIKDKPRTGITDWYYIRVIQSNGSLAWSSPVWVNKKH